MMKNDITYEYRVFTRRPVDVESMEVGRCTSKVIKELKSKDKVDGRFFHTSDTDEWYFCWDGELQKLNLKGNSDVNAALAEVKKLIGEANTAVSEAKATAKDAADAAAEAKKAADDASGAVESIEKLADDVAKKADKSDVENVTKSVNAKQDAISDLETIRSGAALGATALQSVPKEYVTETSLADKKYATVEQVDAKQDAISDLEAIRSGAALGATALQEIPITYATKEFVEKQIEGIVIPTDVSKFTNDAGYITKSEADGYYVSKGTTGSGDSTLKEYVDGELAKKQNVIDDLEAIRTGASLGASAIQSIPEDYITEGKLEGLLINSNTIKNINDQIAAINETIGEATALTNTILNA
jgi:hypothetical protein